MSQVEEYDPFAELEGGNEEYARPRPINTLTPGQEYKLTNVFQTKSQYPDADGKCPLNTLIQYYDEGLKFQSILPRKFNNKSQQWLDAMNKHIKHDVGPRVVYYGMVSMSYEVDLLRHTQQASASKLEIIQRIMAQTTPKKSNAHTTPTKRPPTEQETTPSKKPNLNE